MGLKDLELYAQQESQHAQQRDVVNQSLNLGLDQNPDEYAKLLKLSAQTGVAPPLAKDFRPELEKRSKLESLSVDDLVRTNPKTSLFLTNADNAAVAHDDVQSLSALEVALTKGRDYVGSVGSGVIGKGAGSTLSGAGELYGVATRSLENLLDKVLPNSVMSTLRTPIPWYLDPEQVLKRPGATLKQAGKAMAAPRERQGLDTDVVEGIGQIGFQISAYLMTGGTLSSTMLYSQGADVMAEKTAKDIADPGLRDTAILAGGAITKITEQYGLDKILNRVPPEVKNRTLRFLADKAAAFGIEFAQEITEGLLHDLTRRVLTNENAPILEGALNEGTAAGLSAAIVRAALGVRGYRQAKRQEELVTALSDGGKNSKLYARLPEKYREFIANVTEDGPVQNVFIPVERFNTFFQSQDQDPAAAAEGLGAKNYAEALTLGSDVVIPIDRFAADVAPTDALQSVIMDIKFSQSDMTQRERQEYEAERAERDAQIEQLLAEQDAQGGVNQAIQEIVTDVEGQLVSIGTDPTTARAQATALRGVAVLVERDLKAQAERDGREITDDQILEAVRKVWEGYGLTINRPMPEILSQQPTSDITIDPLLDALRAGSFPTDQQIFGRSLAEFVRDSGGLVAMGETLTAQENMERRPFQKNLVQPTGMTIDKALELAVQAGYFPGQTTGDLTEADFLDALDNDLRGGGVFSVNVTDNNALAMREAMNALGDYLDSLGIDLNTITSNAGVRRLIDNARRDPNLEGIVGELEQLVNQVLGQQGETTLFQRAKEQPAGREVPTSIDEVSNVEAAFEFAGTQSFATNRDFKLAIQARTNQAAKDAKVNLEEFSKGTEDYLVRIATADGITALRTNANAVGWYNEKVTKALRLVSLIHPEVSTDPQAKFAFVWAMAVTSNGLKVDKNFELAEMAYERWKSSGGVMPTDIGIGTAAGPINKALGLYNTLISKHGFDVVEKFMTTMQKAGDVEKFTGQKISGENLTTMVYGAAALGPKIGNGFFMNLYGRFEQLTMDRWLMRTWGRWTGTLVEINQAQIKAKRAQLKEVIRALSPADKKAFEAIIKRKLSVSDIDAVGVAIWKASQKKANRVEMAKIGVFDEAGAAKIVEIMGDAKKSTDRVSYGDELRKVGNALTKYLDGQKEMPSGPPERGNIRKVFGQVLAELQKTYPALTMSDYQALLWYPEKRLYDAAKTADEATDGYEDNEAPDYANAAAKLARAKGISDADIAGTIAAVDAELQAADSAAGVRPGERGSGDRTTDQANTLYQGVDQTQKPGFQAWSNGHPVVPMGEEYDFRSGEGVVVESIHATTGDFDTFDRSKGNIESDLGAGFYSTNNTADAAANYAGMGPDLTQKIDRLAEQIASETDREYNDPDVVAEAQARYMANEGLTMPVFVRFDNPVVLGGDGETFLDYNEDYNEETDEYGEPTGSLVDLVMAVRELGDDGSFEMDTEAAVDALMQDAMDNGGLKASEAIESLKKALVYAVDYETGDSATNEIVRQAFERAGYDGFIDTSVNKKFGSEKRVGKPMVGMDETTVHFIAFKPDQMASRIGSTWERGDVGANILKQGDDLSNKRGFIQFGANRKFNITLLEKANLSTFLHESGHFYLEVLGDLATAEGASEQIKDDYAKVLKFLGLESREQLTLDGKKKGSAEYNRAVEAHEKFARANEAYLMEGNAPSVELQNVFQSFKSWLIFIYKQLSALDVKLTNEVREVLDRIYATDAEIEAAKSQVNVDPLFLNAADAGMSEQEFALYRESIAQATESGKESLMAKLMRELQRERKTWWKSASDEMRKEVTKEVDEQPVYRAFAALVAGKIDEETPVKLNKQALIDKYGADYVKRLPRSFGRIYTTQGGMDADTAAEMLGFDSGDRLIEALVGMRDRKELIDAETDVRMRQTYGDMMTDGTIADEAKIALHNSQRENVLMAELRALRRKQREVAPFVQAERNKARADRQQARAATDVPPADSFRRAARGLVGQTAVRDLDPYRYLQASRKAAKQAFAAMAKGDYQLAAEAKQKELLNHYIYIEATQAREQADKILKYAQRFEKGTTREQMGKAGASYLEQIDAILDRYEFRRVPLSKIDRRASLADWIAQEEAAGNEPSISPVLLNESRLVNYRSIPMDELRAIYDAVRNIEHLARLKNKLLTKQAEIEFDDAIAELVAAAENMTAGASGKAVGQRKPLPLDLSALTMRERAGDTVTRLDAMLVKMEQIVEWLDNGNVQGPWHTYLWNPIAEAQNNEFDLTRALTERLAKSLEAMPKDQRLSMLDTFDVPGMGKVTRKFLISVALNMGNQGNIDKMMRGMGWDMGTIELGLTKLTDADWTFVQETWDTINSVWPQIAELEKRMTGLEPPKVEATPYSVRDAQGNITRTLPGGYYPLVYDPRKSEQGAKQETGNLGQLFEEGYVRATTPKGHTQARMEGFAAPMLLDFEQVVTQHMAKVVKDLTHREAVVMANKILTNRDIRTVLQETLGPAYEKQLLPWLRSVVNDRNGGSTQGLSDFSRWMMTARANVVAATMGFKATTMIAQITGLSQSLDKVKGRYLGQAVLEYLRHPVALTRQVRELSGEMRNRSNSLDRDIRDQLRNLTGQTSNWAQAQRFAFHGIAIVDAMVTVPTWMGAYRQALDEGASEETARLEADAAVRMTQGAGGAKDLAAIQRNNELAKSLTMFYSYFSVLYNRMRDMGRDVQEIRDMPRFLSRVFFTVMVPAVLGELILGRGPDDDEDPAAWTIRKVLLYPMMTVPVLRDVVSSIDSGFDYRFSPMASLFEKIGKAATSTGKLFEGKVEWDEYSIKVAETIGYVFGVAGTAQMSATGKYLWRVSEGEEQPDNLAELLYYAAVGKRKED